MCGIIGSIGYWNVVDNLFEGLENLEYRGYDSAGIAIRNGQGVEVFKQEGTVSGLIDALSTDTPTGRCAIGHTRWSTHGPPTDENAHPHVDCTGQIAVVHNGIIDNHETIRRSLESTGHVFTSETDSEVVPHLVESYMEAGHDELEAFRRTVDRLEGSFALVMVTQDGEGLIAARRGSPLVLGVHPEANFIASDVPAFIEFTDTVVYVEDGDIAYVTEDGYELMRPDGETVYRPEETISWEADDARKGEYDHFMLKEINEQPVALRQTIQGRLVDGDPVLEDFPPGSFDGVERVHLIACGTSYHAAMVGRYFLTARGVPAEAHLASEFVGNPPPLSEDELVIGVSQSGETADTLEALRRAKRSGVRTFAVTNVVGSTITRECDDSLFIRAGPEIGVAATKTFSSQVATLIILGERMVRDITGEPSEDFEGVAEGLLALPDAVETTLERSRAGFLSSEFMGREAYFFIGRGMDYPIALEGALKFKEITYEHAEGFAAGELKHGPLALVNEDTPVFAISNDPNDEKLRGNIREVQSRSAPVIAVAPDSADVVLGMADATLSVPDLHPVVSPILANVQLQLVSYHVADQLSRPIDKPRNLAKSVTVE